MIYILCLVVAVLALFIILRWHAKHSFFTVTGRFIGESSCGFTHGFIYRVDIVVTYFPKQIWVFTLNSEAKCPYSSREDLLANWEIPVKETFQPMGKIVKFPEFIEPQE